MAGNGTAFLTALASPSEINHQHQTHAGEWVGAKTTTHGRRSESPGNCFYFQLCFLDFTRMFSGILIWLEIVQTLSRDLLFRNFRGDLCCSVLCAEEWSSVHSVMISDCLMLCKLLTITNVYGGISRTMTQYGNNTTLENTWQKCTCCQLGTCKLWKAFTLCWALEKRSFKLTLCETHGKTAHFRVPNTAVVSKAKYNGIYEKFQQVNKKNWTLGVKFCVIII